MKYDARKHWTLDVEIVADHSELCCEQVIYCARELGKACYRHGGLETEIGDNFYHWLHIWATADADIAAIVQIISVMCFNGCYATCSDGDDWNKRQDYLLNFNYRLSQINALY